MSLGAIDFGLIVDGAVIIVENAVRRLGEARGAGATGELTPRSGWTVVQDAAVEVRSASVFGEAIIAIVYLPILALRGIEGKLFHPMARTVLFALLGAFILSLTLVPGAGELLRSRPTRRARDLAHAAGAPRLRAAAPPRAGAAVHHAGRRSGAARARRAACSRASAPSSCRSSTRATCCSRRGGCPGSRCPRRSRPTCGIERALLRHSRGRRTSSRAPARPRSPPIRWASSRATSTSPSSRGRNGAAGLTKDAARRGDRRGRRARGARRWPPPSRSRSRCAPTS